MPCHINSEREQWIFIFGAKIINLQVKIQFGHLCLSLGDYPNAIVVFMAIAAEHPDHAIMAACCLNIGQHQVSLVYARQGHKAGFAKPSCL